MQPNRDETEIVLLFNDNSERRVILKNHKPILHQLLKQHINDKNMVVLASNGGSEVEPILYYYTTLNMGVPQYAVFTVIGPIFVPNEGMVAHLISEGLDPNRFIYRGSNSASAHG